MAYGFMYKDFQEDKGGLFYNGDEINLKYCLDPKEAKERYEKNKS